MRSSRSPGLFEAVVLASFAGGAVGRLIAAAFLGKTSFAAEPFERAGQTLALLAVGAVHIAHHPRVSFLQWRFERLPYQAFVAFVVVQTLVMFVAGVVHRFPLAYLVDDTSLPLIGVAFYLFARQEQRLAGDAFYRRRSYLVSALADRWVRIGKVLAFGGFGLALLGIALESYEGGELGVFTRFTDVPIPLVSFLVISCAVGAASGCFPLRHTLPQLALVALMVPSLNRSIALQLLLAFGLVLFAQPARSRRRLGMLAAVVTVTIVGVVVTTLPDSALAWRIRESGNALAALQNGEEIGKDEPSIFQRIWEANLVMDTIGDADPFTKAAGFGAGATLDMQDAPDRGVSQSALLGGDTVHNIHLLPFALLYRQGVIGLLACLWFSVISARVTLAGIAEFRRERKLTAGFVASLYILASILFATAAANYYLYHNPLMLLCAGIIDGEYSGALRGPS